MNLREKKRKKENGHHQTQTLIDEDGDVEDYELIRRKGLRIVISPGITTTFQALLKTYRIVDVVDIRKYKSTGGFSSGYSIGYASPDTESGDVEMWDSPNAMVSNHPRALSLVHSLERIREELDALVKEYRDTVSELEGMRENNASLVETVEEAFE